MPIFKEACEDQSYLDIYHALWRRWEKDMPWIAISAAVFDICPTTNAELTMATVALLDMEI
jgi:hypothetical protein